MGHYRHQGESVDACEYARAAQGRGGKGQMYDPRAQGRRYNGNVGDSGQSDFISNYTWLVLWHVTVLSIKPAFHNVVTLVGANNSTGRVHTAIDR